MIYSNWQCAHHFITHLIPRIKSCLAINGHKLFLTYNCWYHSSPVSAKTFYNLMSSYVTVSHQQQWWQGDSGQTHLWSRAWAGWAWCAQWGCCVWQWAATGSTALSCPSPGSHLSHTHTNTHTISGYFHKTIKFCYSAASRPGQLKLVYTLLPWQTFSIKHLNFSRFHTAAQDWNPDSLTSQSYTRELLRCDFTTVMYTCVWEYYCFPSGQFPTRTPNSHRWIFESWTEISCLFSQNSFRCVMVFTRFYCNSRHYRCSQHYVYCDYSTVSK